MREVTGLTITQGLFACLSGAWRHNRRHCVSRRLVAIMGPAIAVSALAGAVVSHWVANETLVVLFALLAVCAAILMVLPRKEEDDAASQGDVRFSVPAAILIAVTIGGLGGMVGQGGSFILIPLMLYALKLPTRIVIGSNLAIVFLSSFAGFAGKLLTGQIPVVLGVLLVVSAIPGAQIGSSLSHRTRPKWLRTALAVVVALSAAAMMFDVWGQV